MTDYTQLTDEEMWGRVTEVSGRDRVEVLVELSDRAMRVHEFTRAQTLLQEACTAADEVGDRRWVAEILNAQGAAAFSAGDVDVAIGCYGQAAEVHCEIGMTREAAQALLCQADAYRESDALDDCLAAAVEARGLAEFDKDSAVAGEACHLQASTLLSLGMDSEALQACDAGRTHFQQAGRADRVAQIHDMAVTAHLRVGQLHEAHQVARDFLAVARLSGKNTSRARYRMAEVFLRRGKHKKALREAAAAQQEYRRAGDLVGVAKCQWLGGDALMGLGRRHEALDAFEQARALFEAAGHVHEALCCQVDQAIAWQVLGKHAKGERINRRLVRAFAEFDPESIDARWSAVRLLENLISQRRYDDCCNTAEELMALWPEGSTAATPSYREFLGQWTWALAQTGHDEYAVAMANHVINGTPPDLESPAAANSREVRGRHRLDHHRPGAVQDLARAISTHLAFGQVGRAIDLALRLAQTTADTRGAAYPTPSTPSAA
jgi:tetratricopeptide (TPR) repeat protein